MQPIQTTHPEQNNSKSVVHNKENNSKPSKHQTNIANPKQAQVKHHENQKSKQHKQKQA